MKKALLDATFKLTAEINALRAERIELLKCEFDYTTRAYAHNYKRLRVINKRLYELTGNEIYNKP
jgi:hypothetical protein